MPNARSIHIGLNYVDPAGYNGWNGKLSGCINDATDMQAMADSLGYSSTKLIDSDATTYRVVSEIGQAARELESGDILFLSYSGHGGQFQDVTGEEDDNLDETWCLWDRQLIDDELYCLWSRFNPGVRVVVLSDSCHSGTVARMLKTVEDLTQKVSRSREAPSPEHQATIEALTRAIGIEPEELANAAARGCRKAPTRSLARSRSATPVQSGPATSLFGVPRCMPADVQELVNETQREANTAAQYLAGPSERANVSATVILVSGCQDDQLSMDGTGNGLFTEKVKAVWNDGGFSGSYEDFCNAIKSRMPAKQQPNYFVVGTSNPTFEAQNPFEIGDGTEVPFSPSPEWTEEPVEPSYSNVQPDEVARAVLRIGSTGPDVKDCQEMLRQLGHNIAVDGKYGSGTATAVRAFQREFGLPETGVVDRDTWSALESSVESRVLVQQAGEPAMA
jgi:metacaspase-1